MDTHAGSKSLIYILSDGLSVFDVRMAFSLWNATHANVILLLASFSDELIYDPSYLKSLTTASNLLIPNIYKFKQSILLISKMGHETLII